MIFEDEFHVFFHTFNFILHCQFTTLANSLGVFLELILAEAILEADDMEI